MISPATMVVFTDKFIGKAIRVAYRDIDQHQEPATQADGIWLGSLRSAGPRSLIGVLDTGGGAALLIDLGEIVAISETS